jgi:predicted ATP-dependent serine protease
VLDSYQDVLVKLKEVHNWKSTYAEGWLTNIMVEAAEISGVAIMAIQHMTKGGTYVGSTYLKHATTSMMEIRFDSHGGRYLMFSKNRRGGSTVNKPLYYDLAKDGSVVYDEQRFVDAQEAREFSNNEASRQQELNRAFESMFGVFDEDAVEIERGE